MPPPLHHPARRGRSDRAARMRASRRQAACRSAVHRRARTHAHTPRNSRRWSALLTSGGARQQRRPAMDLDLDKAASRLKKEQKARVDKERQNKVLS